MEQFSRIDFISISFQIPNHSNVKLSSFTSLNDWNIGDCVLLHTVSLKTQFENRYPTRN